MAFCEKFKKDYPQIDCGDVFPIIKCYSKFALGNDGQIIEGYYNNKTNDIELFGVTRISAESLKENIRHECLHYLLHKAGLPYTDNDNLFLLLALSYNAKPYKLLTALGEKNV